MLTIPGLLFGVLLSTLYGIGFFFLRGGRTNKFILYLLLAWFGFWIGHYLGDMLGWTFSSLGSLRLGMATLTSGLFLAIGNWLSPPDAKK
jgi:hypothetical protein